MKEELLKKLEAYHKKQGIGFFNEKDAEEYFRGLVELVESFIDNDKTLLSAKMKCENCGFSTFVSFTDKISGDCPKCNSNGMRLEGMPEEI